MSLTLAIVKPDAVQRGLAGRVLAHLEEKGFRLRAARMMRLSTAQARAFYAVHRERSFFEPLVRFMTSGPCLPLVLERDDAVAELRHAIGATDPAEAEAGTVRALFAESKERNAIHASDAPETAEREIAFFFAGADSSGHGGSGVSAGSPIPLKTAASWPRRPLTEVGVPASLTTMLKVDPGLVQRKGRLGSKQRCARAIRSWKDTGIRLGAPLEVLLEVAAGGAVRRHPGPASRGISRACRRCLCEVRLRSRDEVLFLFRPGLDRVEAEAEEVYTFPARTADRSGTGVREHVILAVPLFRGRRRPCRGLCPAVART